MGATGGVGATGGTGGAVSCNPPPGTPAGCDSGSSDPCQQCVETQCCAEWGQCVGSQQDPCAFGGPSQQGEIICIQDCVLAAGVADPTTLATCAGNCTTPGCGTISSVTNDLIACIDDYCFSQCLQP